MRIIQRRLNTKANKKAREHLTAALCNRRTKAGATQSIEQAINAAASPNSAAYITANWSKNSEQWANYARDHSALLLQVTSTNPLESWHQAFKSHAKILKVTKPRYSLAGTIDLISQFGHVTDSRAQKAKYDWSKKKLKMALSYPWLNHFPYPIQLLLLTEIQGADILAQNGNSTDLNSDQVTCSCLFQRSYWLPCKHVIYAFYHLRSIPEPDWLEYANLFDESGYEIYLSRDLVEVEEESLGLESRALQAKLNTSEALDQIRSRFFEIEQFSSQLDNEERDRLLLYGRITCRA